MDNPQANWEPVLFFEDREGLFQPVTFDQGLFEDDHIKQTLRRIYTTLRERGAVQAGFVTPVWLAPYDEAKADIRAKDREDKEEMIMVTHVTKESAHAELARVIRSDTNPPTLSPWIHTYDGVLEIGGSIANTLRKAVL